MRAINRTLLKIVFGLLGVCTVSAAPLAQEVPGVSKDEIKIGTFGALVGPNYIYGKLTMNGLEAAFAKVNEEGGVHGRKLALIRQDDRCDPAAAIAAVKKLVFQDNVFAIVGGGCSNATLGAKPELIKAEVPYINFSAAADAISAPPVKNIYTVVPTSGSESRAQLKYALDRGAKKIAVVAQHDAWGQNRYEPLMAEFKRLNVTPVVDLEMALEDNDATPQALKIMQAGADAVILQVYPKPGAVLARSLNRVGSKPMLIGHGGIGDPVAFSKLVAVPGASDKFVAPAYTAYTAGDPEVADWAKRLKAMFPNDELIVYTLTGIGVGQVVVAALREAGPDLTREKFLNVMGKIKVTTDIFPAPIECDDPVSHQCYKTPAWVRADGEKVVPVK